VLLCTHLLAEVEETCSRVLILSAGRVAARGTVSEVSRQAAAPRSGRLRVQREHVDSAIVALRTVPGVETAAADGQPGLLRMTLAQTDGHPEETMNAGVRAIVDAGIPLLSFELEGARLSDAFLAMTESL
jgi:ABC-2 type transport system ATP-binding protein